MGGFVGDRVPEHSFLGVSPEIFFSFTILINFDCCLHNIPER